jgi:hypothetical protein
MLLQTTTQDVEIHGAEEESTSFSIAMNAKAFKVLSSTLYQDKVGSIIRETCTNALDSHIMQGNPDEPFVVHLPDEFEPWFAVKDFGVGLSSDQVKHLYTTYFASTKDQSNDCTGAFGLGSKVSFSYTDQFTVQSVFAGVKSIYSAYLTASGIPAVQLMHQEESTERNGVEIKISVKREDYRQFQDKTKEQLKFFKVKPIVENAPYGFEFPDVFSTQVIAETASLRVTARSGNNYIIQGPVGYPFDIYAFESVCKDEDAKSIVRRFNTAGSFQLHCPIGSIGVTASREAMEYTDLTVGTISAMMKAAYAEIQQNFTSKIQTYSNNWEIAKVANESDLFGDKEAYKKAFKTNQAVPTLHRQVFSFELDVLKFQGFQYLTYMRKHNAGSKQSVEATGTQCIYIADACKYQAARIKQLSQNTNFILVRLSEGVTVFDLAAALGGYSDFKLISSVPYVAPVRGVVRSAKTQRWAFRNHYATDLREWHKVQATAAPENEECLYVFVEKLEFVDSKDMANAVTYEKFVNADYVVPKLFAIRPKDEAAFKENNPEAMQLKDWLAIKKEELLPAMKKAVKYSKWLKSTTLGFNTQIVQALKGVDSKLSRLIQLNAKLSEKQSSSLCNFADRFGVVSSSTNFANNLLAVKDSEIAKRPILAVDSWQLSRVLTPEQLKAYVALEV